MIRSRKRKQFTIFLIDLIVLYGALYLALFLRNGTVPSVSSLREHLVYFSIAFIGWAVVFYTAGMYALEAPFDRVRFATALLGAVTAATLLTALMFYLGPDVPIAPKTVLFLFAILAYVLILSWRFGYGKLAKAPTVRLRVGFIGASEEAVHLSRMVEEKPYLGYSFAFIHDEVGQCPDSILPCSVSSADLVDSIRRYVPDLFVMVDSARLSMETRRILFDQTGKKARFMSLQDFYELLERRIPVNAINEAWFLENINLRDKSIYLVVKRILDLVLAGLIIILTSPVLLLLAIGIGVESKGPVIFKQIRLGRMNKPFTILKFRTMRVEGNTFNPTSVGDSRITGFGNFLRKTRLDELPQMINILRGEMSFVGPRPERPELAEELAKAIPFYHQRHLVKPGLTGWDQVSGEYHSPSIEDTYKKLQFDLYYVKNVSVFLDVSIFFKTILTVLSRSGR